MGETIVRQRREGAVLVLTLDGPESRNSISAPCYLAVQKAVLDAAFDPQIRAILLTGAGGFFSSGGNIEVLKASAQLSMGEVTRNTDALGGMILALRNCPKPVVAAVEGGAAGAGFSMALAADLLIAAEGAKFTVAYVKIGLTPDGGMTHFLSRSLPRQLVSEMAMLGGPVEASRLAAFGVVNRLVAPGSAEAEGLALAQRLAEGPATSLATIKALVAAAAETDLAAQFDAEARGINRARYGAEAREGLAAFLEKRRPDFTDKA